MKIKIFTFNSFGENSYLIYNELGQAILVDPGFSNKKEYEDFTFFVENTKITICDILLTHAHIDHILGLKASCNLWSCVPYVHENEKTFLDTSQQLALSYQLDYEKYEGDFHYINNQTQQLKTALGDVDIIHAPGHSPGSICFYFKQEKYIIAGDVLFLQSIGRTDLPGGDFDILINSIRNGLFKLPNETKVYPGHGQPTYIGYEKEYNPFLKAE